MPSAPARNPILAFDLYAEPDLPAPSAADLFWTWMATHPFRVLALACVAGFIGGALYGGGPGL